MNNGNTVQLKTDAMKAGADAYNRKASAAPVHDRACMALIAANPGKALFILDAWAKGWRDAGTAAWLVTL